MRETQFWSLGWEESLEKEMATHSSTLAWKIPWMEEPGRLQSVGSQRVRHDFVTSLSFSFTDKTIDFMNHYWWGNINKTAKNAYLTCPVVWSAAWGSLFVLLPDILNYLMDHLKSGKWISYNFLHLMDINMFLSHPVGFQTGLKASLADWPLLWWKSFWKILLSGEWLLNFKDDQETHLTGQVLLQTWAIWLVLQHFHCTYHSQSSDLVEHINNIIGLPRWC